MINVYSDASVSSGIAIVTVIVLTDSAFLGYRTAQFSGINTSLHGELLGILEGVNYINTLDLGDNDIVFHTDCIDAVRLINDETTKVPKYAENLLNEIKELIDGVCVSIEHIQGHQMEHNPNKIVDLVSRTILRNTLKENSK